MTFVLYQSGSRVRVPRFSFESHEFEPHRTISFFLFFGNRTASIWSEESPMMRCPSPSTCWTSRPTPGQTFPPSRTFPTWGTSPARWWATTPSPFPAGSPETSARTVSGRGTSRVKFGSGCRIWTFQGIPTVIRSHRLVGGSTGHGNSPLLFQEKTKRLKQPSFLPG